MIDYERKRHPLFGAQIIKEETSMSNQPDIVVSTERRKFIIQAFVALPFLIAGVFLLDIAHKAMNADFSEISTSVLWMIAFILAGGALMAMLLRTFDREVFKGVALLLLVVWMGHSLDHAGEGLEAGFNTQFPFNFALDVIGFWTLVFAWKWARLKKQASLQAITT